MTLIFSQNNEFTTQKVIDWLCYYDKPWVRINEDDRIVIEDISFYPNREPQIIIRVNDQLLDLSEIKSYWYRRGWFNITPGFFSYAENSEVEYHIRKYIKEEVESLASFMFWYLKTYKHSLSDFQDAQNKKLTYLTLAQRAGLQIPKTFITSSADLLKINLERSEELITKGIHEVISFDYGKRNVFSFTSKVDREDVIANTGALFSPSLFQDCIEKQVELRIFFIDTELYAMAIFSQENEKTDVDFRDYDNTRPNRNVPFQLPEQIASNIKKFIILSGLDTGSIDMILTPNDEFIFLEVNPVGQFGMTSLPCNYFLEDKVAKYLIA